MTGEKIKEEFEKWLRSYCFQAPPNKDYQLMKDVWTECSRAAERLGKIEVLEEIIDTFRSNGSKVTTMVKIERMLAELKAGQ